MSRLHKINRGFWVCLFYQVDSSFFCMIALFSQVQESNHEQAHSGLLYELKIDFQNE